jgi:uncharacterized protein YjbI with pentapeptide repeats
LEEPRFDLIDFSGFVFPRATGSITFAGSEFAKRVDFTNATFQGPADFSKFRFRKGAEFRRVIFEQDALFHESIFDESAHFGYSVFRGEGEFVDATFQRHVDFTGVNFEKGAIFMDTKFREQANFRQFIVKNHCSFKSASFDDSADFSAAVLAGGCSFYRTTFNNAYFKRTVFLGNAWLGARFNGIAEFERTLFQRDPLDLDDLDTLARASDLHKVSITSFESAIVPESGEVRFVQPIEHKPWNNNESVTVNWGINRVSFLNADVERFNFQDVEWGRHKGRRIMIEELVMGKRGVLGGTVKSENITADQVRQAYARVRKNQEAAMRYAEAGDFFIGEMEMRRRSLRERGRHQAMERLVLWLFSNLANYGESIARPILWTFVFIGLFSVLRVITGEHQTLPVQTYWNQTGVFSRLQTAPISWNESLLRSVAAFFQLRSPDYWTDATERILSIPILGSLFIALKRKFERKS